MEGDKSISDEKISVKQLTNIFRETIANDQSSSVSIKRERTISASKFVSNAFPDIIIEENTQQKAPPPKKLVKTTYGGINWTVKDQKYSKSKTNGNYEEVPIEETIFCERSGSIIGVKNKVKNAMANILRSHSEIKTQEHRDVEKCKIVVYVTTNGIVRETFHKCLRVKTILATHRIAFEERNIFIQAYYLKELRDRLENSRYSYYEYAGLEWEDSEEYDGNGFPVPQVFVEGRHLGGADRIESLNESGQLKNIMKNFMSSSANVVCGYCGNYRVQMCEICKGSKKSLIQNNFSSRGYANYFQLRCTNCDENGLVPCNRCSSFN